MSVQGHDSPYEVSGTSSFSDTIGSVERKTQEEMQSQEFVDLLNNNRTSITTDIPLAKWQYNEGSYPTLTESEKINFIEDGKVTITNTLKDFTTIINKVDEETKEPIPDTKFVIYSVTASGTTIDFAKDKDGKYIGKLNKNGEYEVSTNKNGQLRLELPGGLYKAVEVKAAEGYVLELRPEDRTKYFSVDTVVISNVEDLVDLSNKVNAGETFEGKTVVLANTIDFEDTESYRNADDTETYGDYNGDGTVQTIKEELTATKESGLKPIGNDNNPFKGTFDGKGLEIKNIQVFADDEIAYAGVFGQVNSGKIKNLTVTDITIYSNDTDYNTTFGGIVGRISNGKIVNCYTKGIVDATVIDKWSSIIGGIAGSISNSEIINCHNTSFIEADGNDAGGIALSISNSKVFNCSNTGKVAAVTDAGGIADSIYSSEIINCHNAGEIAAYSMAGYIGGIANYISGSNIINCYNTGSVHTSNIGGYAGGIGKTIINSKIINCYNAGKVESGSYSDGNGNSFDTSIDTAGGIASGCGSTSILNTYYLNTSASTGIYSRTNVTGSVSAQTQTYMQSQAFANLLNSNRASIETDIPLADWIYNSGLYPTLRNENAVNNQNSNQQEGNTTNIKFIEDKDIVITNEKEFIFTINKVDKETKEPIPNVKFKVYRYSLENAPEVWEFVSETMTDENGQIRLALGKGYYKAIETQAAEGYALSRDVKERTIYFKVAENSKELADKEVIDADFVIRNEKDLVELSNRVNAGETFAGKKVVLANTIDFKNQGFTAIGNSNNPFKGTFDGQGYEIQNVNIQSSDYVGVFGTINSAKIINLGVSNITGGTYYRGGIAGDVLNSELVNCYNVGRISSHGNAGGIAHSISNSKLYNCYNIGEVSAQNVGGIAYSILNSRLQNCYSIGKLTCINGGGIACNNSNSSSILTDTYYLETIASAGIYNKSDVEGSVDAKTQEDMQSQGFVDLLNGNRDEIETEVELAEWQYNEGGYPTLSYDNAKKMEFIEGTEVTITNEKKVENNLVIKKVDKETKQKLAGASFNIIANMNDAIGEMKSDSQYSFIPYGKSGYQSNNYNIANSVANAYLPIDLREYSQNQNFSLKVNYSISSQSSYDYGYATITKTKTVPTYTQNSYDINTYYRFIYTSGTGNNYTNSVTLKGGDLYYLHIGYRKDGSTNTNNDRFYINSINLEYNQTFKTNEEGIIELNVPIGEYTIKETVAPLGYKLNSTPQIVEVSSYSQVTESIIENEKEEYAKYDNFILTKKDRITEELLEGVKFSILDEQGNYAKDLTGAIIGEKEVIDGQEKYVVTTDENGQIKLKLDIGKYKLVEVKALEGYELEEPQEFEITGENQNAEIVWQINPISTHYPEKDYVRVTSDGGMVQTNYGVNKTIPAEDTVDNEEIQVVSDKAYIVKYDEKGKVEKLLQIPGFTGGTAIYEDTDGNYIVIGEGKQVEIPAEDTVNGEAITLQYEGTNNRTIILKLDSDFKVIWGRNMDSFYPSNSYNLYIGENKAGNYIISMNRLSNGSSNILIPAEDTAGNKEITMEFDSSKNNVFAELNKEGKIISITQIVPNVQGLVEKADGGYIVSQNSTVYDYDSEMNLVKQSPSSIGGARAWPTQDEGFIIIGTTYTNMTISGEHTISGEDITILSTNILPKGYLIKFNKDFKIEWVKTDEAVTQSFCIRQLSSGEYVELVAAKQSGFYLNKYNSNGDIIGRVYFNSSNYPYVIYTNSDMTEFAVASNGYTKYEFNEELAVLELEATNVRKGTVIVHHYLEETGPEFDKEPVVLADDEILTGTVPGEYTTAPKLDIPGYTLIRDDEGEYIIPENASGDYNEKEEQHVYYYYTVAGLKLTVHHYLEGTENKLAEDENYYYQEGDHYKVTPSEELLEKYELVSVVGYEEKDITENEVVTYYYKEKRFKITTRVEIPEEELEEGRTEKGGEISGEVQEPYESVLYGEDSKEDIIITPHLGYKVGTITINGQELPFTPQEDGKVQLDKFLDMTEDKEVVVTFVPVIGRVITHHYLQGTTEKLHDDIINDDKIGSEVQTAPVTIEGYKVVDSAGNKDENGNVIIVKSINEGVEEIIYYYQKAYIITTDVIEHTENYKDGTVETNVKGGTITNEDVVIHEQVLRCDSNKEIIEKIPDENYEIAQVKINGKKVKIEEIDDDINEDDDFENVIITSKLVIDENGNITLPKGFFGQVRQDLHVEVEFRRKSKVIVKYLEEGTEQQLAEDVEILGYESLEFETTGKIIPGYTIVKVPVSEESEELQNKITDENKVLTNSNGTMFSDEITVIYWYEKIEANAIERHIETNKKDDEIELEYITYDDSITNIDTQRKEYEKYISIDAPELTKEEIEKNYPNVTIIGKEENSYILEIDAENLKEVWYYYMKQYNITTEVRIPEDELQAGRTEEGGTISKEYETDEDGNEVEVTYEVVDARGNSTKEIKMTPEKGYRIKSVTINDVEIFVDNMIEADGSIKLPQEYFKDVQEDKHVVVEFEKIPAKVIVEYKDVYTKESIIPDKIINGFVTDEYNEERVEIDGYISAEPEPENSKGEMTEDTITITYWYAQPFEITTDIKEHEETDSEGTTILEKGGKITGEDEIPYETVLKGQSSIKEILIVPDSGYRIKSLTINDNEIDIENLLKEDGTIKLPIFPDMQEDKHIVVEFEKIPAIVKIQYLEDGTEKELSKSEEILGYVNDEYETKEKEIKHYELVKEKYPENSKGQMVEETIVKYYYRKLPFNMKIEKDIEKITLNGKEVEVTNKNNAKLEINYKDINKTKLEVTYIIKVTNTEKLEGKTIIEEILPKGFEFVVEESNVSFERKDGKYMLETEVIEPGDTKEYIVTLRWIANKDNKGQFENIAQISKAENEANFKETSTKDNKDNAIVEIKINKTVQDTVGEVVDDVIIGVQTGDPIIIFVVVMLIAGVVLVVSIKKVIKK